MKTTLRIFSGLLGFLLMSGPCLAQVTTGTPPFGSFGGGPDVVNLANLNDHIAIPVENQAGRGMPFTYVLSYDTSVWYPAGASGSQTWTPVGNWGWRGQTDASTGYMSTTTTSVTDCCGTGKYPPPTGWELTISNWTFHDYWGIPHYFSGITHQHIGQCSGLTDSLTATTTDGSGYTLNATGFAGTITSRGGTVIVAPYNQTGGSANATDRNGNEITVNSSGVFTDTLGTTALTIAGSVPSPVTFSYTPPAGGSVSYTMKYSSYTVQTNFGCSGVTDYGPTSNPLVSEIDLPDVAVNPNDKYTFTYEATPGHAGNVTGRLLSVTLPTGGAISYSYYGGSNGNTCADGTAATLTRTTPDGTWTYAHSENGTAWTTTVTDPTSQQNQTVLNFQGIYETERQVYQGSTSGTLLKTITTCYNGNNTNCNTTAITLPITQRTATIALPNGSNTLQCQHNYLYSSFGMPTEQDDYDYGSGAPGSLIRKKLITYAPLGNINAFRNMPRL